MKSDEMHSEMNCFEPRYVQEGTSKQPFRPWTITEITICN